MADTTENKTELPPAPTFIGNLILRGKIECLTGLHIGGSKDKLEIGGVDSPVIRNPQTRYPYIPGSSLKGKLRHLLEYGLGEVHQKGHVSEAKPIVRLFGIGADDNKEEEEAKKKKAKSENKEQEDKVVEKRKGPARLVVRDCNPDKATIKMWENLDSELEYTEYKPENSINRITSTANPRFIERVTADSKFEFEIIYTVYDMGDEDDLEKEVEDDILNLKMAMRMLEHNFLGKAGSRGYGRVRFELAAPIFVDKEAYRSNSDDYKKAIAGIEELDLLPLQKMDNSYFNIIVFPKKED